MAPETAPPKFLSTEFHTGFFPRLLKERWQRKKRERQGTTFTSTMEMMISFAVCLILAIIGIPLAWVQGSIAGWILAILGAGGIAVLVILSVSGQWGEQPTYENFLMGIFLFFVSLGAFIGIPVGMDRHSFWVGVFASVAGLASHSTATAQSGWLVSTGRCCWAMFPAPTTATRSVLMAVLLRWGPAQQATCLAVDGQAT